MNGTNGMNGTNCAGWRIQKINQWNGSTSWIYEWKDDLGFHQYYCNECSSDVEPGLVKNFCMDSNPRVYKWTDNLGYHEYFCD